MNIKYDYHSLVTPFKMMFAVLVCLLLFFLYLHNQSKNSTFNELIPIFITIGIGFIVSAIGYLAAKNTYIEISEEGILFKGLTRKVYSTWPEVREIKLLGRIDKVYTANGNFHIRVIESSESPKLSITDMMTSRPKLKDIIIDEIKRRAPQAKITQSIFLRPL